MIAPELHGRLVEWEGGAWPIVGSYTDGPFDPALLIETPKGLEVVLAVNAKIVPKGGSVVTEQFVMRKEDHERMVELLSGALFALDHIVYPAEAESALNEALRILRS